MGKLQILVPKTEADSPAKQNRFIPDAFLTHAPARAVTAWGGLGKRKQRRCRILTTTLMYNTSEASKR